MKSGKVHIAGCGIVSAIGANLQECFESLCNEKTGIGYSRFLKSIHRDSIPVAEYKKSNEDIQSELVYPKKISRTALLGLQAARELTQQIPFEFKKYRTGFISGNTVGGMDLTEHYFSNSRINLRDILYHSCSRSTELIAEDLGITGYLNTINTACSSSVNAIILGERLIKANRLDIVIAGGADALSAFTLNGFNSLMILDKEFCKPMDAARKGLNLGEGAAYLLLVSEKVILENSLSSLAYISGYANTNDSFHQTASSPDGKGSSASMRQALQMASLRNMDIQYINVHGTGTINNDASEGNAIQHVFREYMPAFSSTKAYTGHTLGASGAIEAVFSILAITHQCVFPNLRFQNPMPEHSLIPQTTFESVPVRNVMSNSFGFGGNCSSIIFSAN